MEWIWRMVVETHPLKSCSHGACPVGLTKVCFSLSISPEPTEHCGVYRRMFSLHYMKCKVLLVIASDGERSCKYGIAFRGVFIWRDRSHTICLRGDSQLGILSPTPSRVEGLSADHDGRNKSSWVEKPCSVCHRLRHRRQAKQNSPMDNKHQLLTVMPLGRLYACCSGDDAGPWKWLLDEPD